MSAVCEFGLALMTACVTLPPDGKPPVIVTHECISRYSAEEQSAAIACAAENNVAWRLKKNKRRLK